MNEHLVVATSSTRRHVSSKSLAVAGESDDDVRWTARCRYVVTQLRDKRAVMIARVAAVHGRKHRIEPDCGKVQRRHERAQRGEPADDLVVEILRVAGGEPQALDARLVERAQHLGGSAASHTGRARRSSRSAPSSVISLHAGGHIALGLGLMSSTAATFASAHGTMQYEQLLPPIVMGRPCRPFVLARRRQLGGNDDAASSTST